jgi:hypothetical protein
VGDYLTLAEVKEKLSDLGSEYDALLTTLIGQASRDIERLCNGQIFEPVTATTKTFDGSGTSKLILPWAWPLVSVTTLKVRTGGEGTTQVTVPAADFYLEPAGRPTADPARWIELGAGLNSGVRVFTAGKGTVEIAGTWGRAAIPGDIKDVCHELVIQAWRNRGQGASNLPGALEGELEMLPRGLTPRAIAILKAHGYQQGIYLP